MRNVCNLIGLEEYSGILLRIGIQNPWSSTDKDWNPVLGSGVHGVESRIQDCLGFPYMGRLIALTKKPIIKPLSICWMRLRQQPIMMGSWLRMLCGIMQINARHFVLFSCKICAEIVVHRMFPVSLNGLNGSRSIVQNIFFPFICFILGFKISYSKYSFVTQIFI